MSTKHLTALAFSLSTMAFVALTGHAQTEGASEAVEEASTSITVTCEALTLGEELYFDYGDVEILPQSEAPLIEIARIILESPWIRRIIIEAHTDSSGSASFNMNRSTKRAHVVRDFLVTQGVPPERLSAQGFGENRPIAPNDTPEGRTQNRRIELVIVDQEDCPY